MPTGVQFEGDWKPPRDEKKATGLAGWLMGRGVKTEKQANVILVALSIIFFLAAIVVALL